MFVPTLHGMLERKAGARRLLHAFPNSPDHDLPGWWVVGIDQCVCRWGPAFGDGGVAIGWRPLADRDGRVTANPRYRAKYLWQHIVDTPPDCVDTDCVAVFAYRLNYDYRRIDQGADGDIKPGECVLVFRVEEMKKESFHNGFTYADTLSEDTTSEFISLTHQKYQEHWGDRLGGSVRGIFIDEPHRGSLMDGFGIQNDGPGWHVPYTQRLFLKNFIEPIDLWCRSHQMVFYQNGVVVYIFILACDSTES